MGYSTGGAVAPAQNRRSYLAWVVGRHLLVFWKLHHHQAASVFWKLLCWGTDAQIGQHLLQLLLDAGRRCFSRNDWYRAASTEQAVCTQHWAVLQPCNGNVCDCSEGPRRYKLHGCKHKLQALTQHVGCLKAVGAFVLLKELQLLRYPACTRARAFGGATQRVSWCTLAAQRLIRAALQEPTWLQTPMPLATPASVPRSTPGRSSCCRPGP